MNGKHLAVGLVAALLATVILAGCPKPHGPAASAVAEEKTPETKAPSAEKPAAEPPAPVITVALTRDAVKNWIASMQDPQVQAALKNEKAGSAPSAGEGLSSLRSDILARGGSAELGARVKTHGFSGGREWAETTVKIFAGWIVSLKYTAVANMDRKSPEYRQAAAHLDGSKAEVYKALAPLTADEQKLVDSMADEIGAGVPGSGKTGGGKAG